MNDNHALSFPTGAKRAIGNPAPNPQMAATLDPRSDLGSAEDDKCLKD